MTLFMQFFVDSRGTEVRLGTVIESLSMKGIHLGFDSAEGSTEFFGEFFKENFTESIA